MGYNRFYFATVFHALLFAVLTYFSVWAQFQEHLKFTGIGFGLLAIVSLTALVFQVIDNNNRIVRFLRNYLINEPYPSFKSPYRDKTFVMIEKELNRLAASYSQVKLDKEVEHHLMNFIVEHIDTAICTMNANGDIYVSNKTFHKFILEKQPLNITNLSLNHPELYNAIVKMKHGSTQLVPIFHNNEVRQILIKMSSFELKGNEVRLCSFDDVTGEMMKAEDRNWQKLLRMLRHEIMNSITPIVSLVNNLIDTCEEQDFREEASSSYVQINDSFYRGLKAIEKRSKGLLTFVKSYKSLIEIPEPSLETIPLLPIFDHLLTLYKEALEKDGIQLIVECNARLKLEANEELIIRVLVNLIRNAQESMQHTNQEKVLKLTAEKSANIIQIIVADTGPGISEDNLDQIFIPFFTTKENGNGIGLSLSRQIVNQLGGTISVKSKHEETVFTLQFNT
jgi:nitrogen fixation/metabolism regulation signal transduction histidine kinase